MDGKITAMDEKMSLMQDSILAAIQELKAWHQSNTEIKYNTKTFYKPWQWQG
jgi:hypothetical protein